MAERRMFAKSIIDSDAFLDMSMSARLLYYDLAMRADDDGFVNSPKKIMRFVGANDSDMDELSNRQFIIPFRSGVIVIRHWRRHNYIRKDAYKETPYLEEKSELLLTENNTYELSSVNNPSTIRQQSVDNPLTQDNKDNKDNKVNKSKGIECSAPQNTKPTRHKYGEYKNVLLSDEELEKLKVEFSADWSERIERLSEYIASSGKSYKNHLATIRKWAKADAEKKSSEPTQGTKTPTKSKFNNYTDANKPDYSNFADQIIAEMLTKAEEKGV